MWRLERECGIGGRGRLEGAGNLRAGAWGLNAGAGEGKMEVQEDGGEKACVSFTHQAVPNSLHRR